MSYPGTLALDNCHVVDVVAGSASDLTSVLVEDGVITAVGGEGSAPGATHLDLGAGYLLPGLIDAHVHTVAGTGDLGALQGWLPSYTSILAARGLEAMLQRGFTRVRDVGGADRGLALAGQSGLINGPTLHYGGLALSQTGGHGDMRAAGDSCSCLSERGISRVVDGADNIRAAVREERRRGASHIKIMLSGGVASPLDVLEHDQYSDAEIDAAVEEAARGQMYVAAHAYTPSSIMRGVSLGVRSIEHGNHLDAVALRELVSHDAFLVPTLATYHVLGTEGAAAGVPAANLEKLGDLFDAGLESLSLAGEAGAKVAFGTDLLGAMQVHQSDEFLLRSKVQPIADTIRSATVVGAELLGVGDTVGKVERGFTADLIAVTADPLGDARVLATPQEHLRLVVVDGRIRLDRTGQTATGDARP